MAILRVFPYPAGNINGQVAYDPANNVGVTFAFVAIDPAQPTDDGQFNGPNDGLVDGEVLVPESCVIAAGGDRTGESIQVVARDVHPYAEAVLTPNSPACTPTAACDLQATANYTASPGNVRLIVATTNTPWSSSQDNVTFFPGREDWPAAPGASGRLYVKDAANCAKVVDYLVPGGSGGGQPTGVVIDDFEPNTGIAVNIYYDATTRALKEYILPTSAQLANPISEQQRGRADGELIQESTRCEGTTQVRFYATLEPPYAQLQTTENSTECGYTVPVLTLQAVGVAPTTVLGSINATPTGGTAPLILSLLGTTRTFPAVSGEVVNIPGLTPGSYQVRVTDAGTQVTTVTVVVPSSTVVVRGCTDPSASNYDSAATEDDGSCIYEPVVVKPYLFFPEPQSLRFVLAATSIDTTRPDNTFLSTQGRAGYFSRDYCQKVARRDDIMVQWRSNFAAHTLQVLDCDTNEVVASFPPTRVVLGKGNEAILTSYLTPHTVGRARLYFDATVLPLPFAIGNRIIINAPDNAALDGNYSILEVREDSAQGVPYLVLGIAYSSLTTSLRVDCTATTTYDVASFDVWQSTLFLGALPAGCYYVRVTASDPALGTVRVQSEPLDLATEHPDTILVSYRNFDNAYGLNYSFGLVNKLRVVARLEEEDPTTSKSILVESDTTTTLLAATARRRLLFRCFQLPSYLHEKLALAFAHDLLLIQGMDYVVEEAYESTPVVGYNLKNGQATLTQRQWLGAGNGDDLGSFSLGQGLLLANDANLQY